MRKGLAQSFTIFILLAILASLADGQIKDKHIFSLIPTEQRSRFIERLNLYLEYVLTNQNEKLKGLYDEQTLCSMCIGRQECIDDCAPPMVLDVPKGFSSKLIELSPYSVEAIKGQLNKY
jgi:hypothetical protein